MLMRNTSANPVNLKADLVDGPVSGEYLEVEAGGTVEIKDGYALPRRAPHGQRTDSTIEQLGYPLEPADPEKVEAWKQTPATDPVVDPKPTDAQLLAMGISPGVAALMMAEAEARAKAQAEAEEKALADAEAAAVRTLHDKAEAARTPPEKTPEERAAELDALEAAEAEAAALAKSEEPTAPSKKKGHR